MISIRPCTPADAAELAQMNRMRIEDEIVDNAMSLSELEQRMLAFLNGGHKAFFFDADGTRAGYALVETVKNPYYLRHFFISRESRRQGIGTQAFNALLEHLGTREMDLDVYVWNTRGLSFWKSIGFSERCFCMRYSQ